jgi:hypothetical protein
MKPKPYRGFCLGVAEQRLDRHVVVRVTGKHRIKNVKAAVTPIRSRQLGSDPINIHVARICGRKDVNEIRSGTTKLEEQLDGKDTPKPTMRIRSVVAFLPKCNFPKPASHYQSFAVSNRST